LPIPDSTLEEIAHRAEDIASRLNAEFPGASPRRQPVHTVYGGAHLFKAGTAGRLGQLAQASLDRYAPDADAFGKAVGMPGSAGLAGQVFDRMRAKLLTEPVEDFRLDFEDGYGNRPDQEEDGHCRSAAAEVATGMREGGLSPFIGVRIKPLSGELHRRSIRTLDLFISSLMEEAGGLPDNFVVTLPKVQDPEQVDLLAVALTGLEGSLGMAEGTIQCELMVETPQSVLGPDGLAGLRRYVSAGRGRVIGAHFGTYDYTASLDITAAHQTMTHPACDFARDIQQVSLAGTGIWLSDGATNVLPVAVHNGPDFTEAQQEDNLRGVHAAWRLHFQHVRHSLSHAYYQGWDLHPAQLPTRYAAVYSFFLEGLDQAGERLSNFVGKAAQATLVGEVFDDAATGQGLLNFFLRAINCGAVTEDEVVDRTGLSLGELQTRSFVKILSARRSA
jgi:citrate lyase beta subunit